MRLDLTRYRRPITSLTRTFEPGELVEGDDPFTIVAPVELSCEVRKDRDRYRIAGTVVTTLELECSRCIEPFRLDVHATFDVRFLPASENVGEEDQEVGEEDLDTGYYRDEEIDLGGLLREQFYLALPMKPLCIPECRGLCPQCGTNLNTGACDCAPAWDDPRLAPLRALGRTKDS